MKKTRSTYVCQSCAYESPQWLGRCPECGSWSMVEELRGGASSRKVSSQPVSLPDVQVTDEGRLFTGIGELDRALGGGMVRGSVVLLAGDPGVGKSTLMLQAADRLSRCHGPILYVAGEESLGQVKLRAQRLHLSAPQLCLLTTVELEEIVEWGERMAPRALIVDSIQAIYTPALESPPGTVSQIRECANRLIRMAKVRDLSIVLIGHVTKEGVIAGPRVLEHAVDAVLSFEGDRQHAFRILRAVKNRFGSTNEIGVFEISHEGLVEVKNPSEFFLSQRREDISGSSVVCSLEGTRPLLVEVQALVTSTNYGVPQRVATGMDHRRLSLLLAILERRVGLAMGTKDVFLNIAGGVRINEPAVDLGAVTAIASSLQDVPTDSGTVLIGEVGLGGEVRAVGQIQRRLQEVEKLGFTRCVVSKNNLKGLKKLGIEVVGVEQVREALGVVLAEDNYRSCGKP